MFSQLFIGEEEHFLKTNLSIRLLANSLLRLARKERRVKPAEKDLNVDRLDNACRWDVFLAVGLDEIDLLAEINLTYQLRN